MSVVVGIDPSLTSAGVAVPPNEPQEENRK